MREHVAALRSVAGAVEELDVEDLQQEVDRTALLGELRSTIFRLEHERPHERNPIFWVNHLFQGLYAVLARSNGDGRRAGARRARAAPRRPGLPRRARETLDEPPSVFVESRARACWAAAASSSCSSPARWAPRRRGCRTSCGPPAAGARGLKRFGTALRDEIEPAADPHAFAIGEEQFARRLHFEHAVVAGAPELWRYGLHLQEETTAQLTALAAGARLPSLARAGGRAPERRARHRRAARRLPGGAGPRARIRGGAGPRRRFPTRRSTWSPTPPFLASLVPFAAYEPRPSTSARQRGRFYVTVPDPSLPAEAAAQQRRGHGRHGIPAMVAHEAYPGHHLQLVTMQELRSEVRRHLWTPIMVEGWALYCEQLLDEAGYYRTPEQRLFQLVNLLWRAIRVVLDVGLHTRGMTPAEAVDYMVEHLPIERRSAEAEVRRYCAWPTYQLCYAVGRRELLQLREGPARPPAPTSIRAGSTRRCWATGPARSRWRVGAWTWPDERRGIREERP